MSGHERAQHHLPDGGGNHHEATRPAVAIDERAEQRRHDGERGQGEEEVQEDLVIGGVRRDGEEERTGERDGDDGPAPEHGALHQRQPADGM